MRFVTGKTVPQVAVLPVHEYCLILQRAGQTLGLGQAMDASHKPVAPPRCQAIPGHSPYLGTATHLSTRKGSAAMATFVRLSTKAKMPIVGLGTWQVNHTRPPGGALGVFSWDPGVWGNAR